MLRAVSDGLSDSSLAHKTVHAGSLFISSMQVRYGYSYTTQHELPAVGFLCSWAALFGEDAAGGMSNIMHIGCSGERLFA